MNKMVGTAEFKAHCSRIMAEAARSGETVIITKRGKPVMELKPIKPTKPRKSGTLFGFLKNDAYRFDDPFSPAYDRPWNAELDNDDDDSGTGLR